MKRDRIVVFRLSQAEYGNLTEVCMGRGTRNVSTFAREALLAAIGTDYVSALREQIQTLQCSIDELLARAREAK